MKLTLTILLLLQFNLALAEPAIPAFVECRVDLNPAGWYSFKKKSLGLLKYANCKNSTDIPVCVEVGTRSEGWIIPSDGKIHYALCANEFVECANLGTRSEGWYVYTKGTGTFLQDAICRE